MHDGWAASEQVGQILNNHLVINTKIIAQV